MSAAPGGRSYHCQASWPQRIRPSRGSYGPAADAADAGAHALELLLQPGVAAVEVVDAVHGGAALGHEAGDDERRGGAQVGGHDGAALEGRGSGDDGGAAVDAQEIGRASWRE